MNTHETKQHTIDLDAETGVNITFNMDKISHRKAYKGLQAVQQEYRLNITDAIRKSLHERASGSLDSSPTILENLVETWNCSNAEAVRESLRRSGAMVIDE